MSPVKPLDIGTAVDGLRRAIEELPAALALASADLQIARFQDPPPEPPSRGFEETIIAMLCDLGFKIKGGRGRPLTLCHEQIVRNGEERELTLMQAIDMAITNDRSQRARGAG